MSRHDREHDSVHAAARDLFERASDRLTPPMFGGNTERALEKLKRAEQLLVASRPPDSSA